MQALGAVTVADLKAKDQRIRQKLELYVGSSWVDLTSLAGVNYLKNLSIQLGGAGVSADPVAAQWSATIANDDNVFHPHHPTSAYADYFRLGRKVRISIGGNYGGSDYLWQRVIGYMDVPRFSMETQELTISGSDYMSTLTDFALKSPGNYWGASLTTSSVETTKSFGAEIYDEYDALSKANEDDSVANYTPLYATVDSIEDATLGSTYVMELVKDTTHTYGRAGNGDCGSVTVGKIYEVAFSYKRTSGVGTLDCYLYAPGTSDIMAQKTDLAATGATTVKFHFQAASTGAVPVYFYIYDAAVNTTTFYIDQFSLREVTARTNTRYPLPAACNGPYYATLDGVPYWLGSIEQGWLYDEANNVFYFKDDVWIETGTNNLIIYYYTTQTVENVVAEILAAGPADGGGGAGLYANSAAALAAMSYVATGVTVPRVWFDAGTKAIDALRMLCELVNYRFWFKYDGTPCFRPAPTAGAPAFEQYDNALFASSESYQDLDGVYNAVIIEGIEQGMYATTEDKRTSRISDTASDATSISTYLERTLSVQNHLFQDTTALTAMCATLLAARKDPKWYVKFDASFFPAPLEMGDTMAWTAWFSASVSAMKWGVIRAVEIADGRVSYTVEVASAWPGPVHATASLPVPVVLIGGARRIPQDVMTATATMPAASVVIS